MNIQINPLPSPEVIHCDTITFELSQREAILIRGILGNSDIQQHECAFNSSNVRRLHKLPKKLCDATTYKEMGKLVDSITSQFDKLFS